MKALLDLMHHHRFKLLVVLFVMLALNLGILIVPLEVNHAGANIIGVEDGVWWAVTTMTGVGLGDVYPVTLAGRVVGMVLEVLGVLVFGLIVGHIAVALFSVRDRYYWNRLDKRLDEVEAKLARIEKNQGFSMKPERTETDGKRKAK